MWSAMGFLSAFTLRSAHSSMSFACDIRKAQMSRGKRFVVGFRAEVRSLPRFSRWRSTFEARKNLSEPHWKSFYESRGTQTRLAIPLAKAPALTKKAD